MLAQHAVVVEPANFARLRGQIAHQKFAKRPLSDKANAGRILLLGHMQPRLGSQAAHLALVQITQRKYGLGELLLIEAIEEIALVLAAVFGLEQLIFAATVVFPAPHARVMARRDAFGAQFHRMVEETAELDFRIAQNVRVGRAPGFIFAQKIGEHALFVFVREIHHFKVDANDVAHRRHIDQILARRAVLRIVVVFPVLHEEPGDGVALLLEQQGRDRRIDPAGHTDHDAHSLPVLALTGHSVPLLYTNPPTARSPPARRARQTSCRLRRPQARLRPASALQARRKNAGK